MIAVDRLKALHIFADSSVAALSRLAEDMIEKTYAKGQLILKEGESSGSLFLIASGSVAVQKRLDKEGDRTKAVARLEAEEFFGEMAFLENQPHSANVVAIEDATLFVLPRASLDRLIDKDAKLALEQVLTLLSGVSSRLRRTTKELVTVFEVSRLLGFPLGFEEMIRQILKEVAEAMGGNVSIGFYRWNMFNDEYGLLQSTGNADMLPEVLEATSPLIKMMDGDFESVADMSNPPRHFKPLSVSKGHVLLAKSDMQKNKEGFFMAYHPQSRYFDPGKRQLLETVAAVLAPALATARTRDEEFARRRMEQNRQQRTSL